MDEQHYLFSVEISKNFAQFIEAEAALRGMSKAELFALAFEKLRQSSPPKWGVSPATVEKAPHHFVEQPNE